MAFQCWFKLPLMSGNGPIEGPITMARIIVRPYKMVAKNDALFVVSNPLGIYEIHSNMKGGLTALKPQEGEIIPENEQFGCMIAEGEDIPYGQPYVVALPISA